jgi:hypothetical protein
MIVAIDPHDRCLLSKREGSRDWAVCVSSSSSARSLRPGMCRSTEPGHWCVLRTRLTRSIIALFTWCEIFVLWDARFAQAA